MISKINIGGIKKMAIQDKFNKANTIYKITKDINLGGDTLTIPEGCTLDFQGGTIGGGTIVFDRTLLLPLGLDVSKYISATITGTYSEGQILYGPSLKKMKLWNGTEWVNLDGTTLADTNAIEEIPASQDITY